MKKAQKIYEVLFRLIRAGLGLEQMDMKGFAGLSEKGWEMLWEVAFAHGVMGVCFDAIKDCWKEIGVPLDSFIRWTYMVEQEEIRHKKQIGVVKYLEKIFGDAGLKFLVLKGEGVGRYYPNPQRRMSNDVDIFLGDAYSKSCEVLRANGIEYKKDSPRHDHLYIDDIMVENHRVLSEFRIRKTDKEIEKLLLGECDKVLKDSGDGGAAVYPTVDFNTTFLPWHASAHFMFESVSLRQIIDWVMFLKAEREHFNEELYRKVNKYSSGKISNIISAICIKKMGIAPELFPQVVVELAMKEEDALVDKVFDYIMDISNNDDVEGKFFKDRWNKAVRMWRERWKFRDVYSLSLGALYWRKFVWFIYDRIVYKKNLK